MPVYDRVRLCVASSTNSMEAIVHTGPLSVVHLKHSCFIFLGVIGDAFNWSSSQGSAVSLETAGEDSSGTALQCVLMLHRRHYSHESPSLTTPGAACHIGFQLGMHDI